MDILRIYHIDDDPRMADKVRKLLAGRDDVVLIGTTTNPIKGLEAVNRYLPDILLLDLEMQPITGWQVMEKVNRQVRVIIITAHDKMGMPSLERGASFFLDKSFGKNQLYGAIDRILGKQAPSSNEPFASDAEYIWLPAGGKSYPAKFFIPDIEVIEALSNYCKVHHVDGMTTVNMGIGEMERILPRKKFMRISRHVIIALSRFHRRMVNDQIELRRINNEKLKCLNVGQEYAKAFYAYLDRQLKNGNDHDIE